MVLNAKFWFLAIHRYQKQPPKTVFAARGRGMKLVIDTVKKWKFENFEQNMCYLPQKKVKKISKIFPMSQWSEIFF